MRAVLASLALTARALPAAARSDAPRVGRFSPEGAAKDLRQRRVRFAAPRVAFGVRGAGR